MCLAQIRSDVGRCCHVWRRRRSASWLRPAADADRAPVERRWLRAGCQRKLHPAAATDCGDAEATAADGRAAESSDASTNVGKCCRPAAATAAAEQPVWRLSAVSLTSHFQPVYTVTSPAPHCFSNSSVKM